MKILIYGENYWFALAPELKKAFEKINCEVELFDWTKFLYTSKGYTVKNRVLNKVFMPKVSKKINDHFIKHFENGMYDCIFVITGWHLDPETIDLAKRHSKLIYNWSIDELFNNVFSSYINPETYLKYDCIFSQRRHLFDSYYSRGIKRIEYFPFYYYDGHYPIVPSEAEKLEWGSDIAFLGSWSKSREKKLYALEGYNVKIWGAHWNRASRDFKKKFDITNKIAWLQDMSRVVNSAKVIVDVLTEEQNDQINLKTYQIPACGGFLLTERTDEVLKLFEEEKEIACYGSLTELREKCVYYLEHNAERKVIANNLYKKVVDGQNNISDRAKTIFNLINEQLADGEMDHA